MNKIILTAVCVLVAVGTILIVQVEDKPDSFVSVTDQIIPLKDSGSIDGGRELSGSVSKRAASSDLHPEADRSDDAASQANDGVTPAWSVIDDEVINVDGIKGLLIRTDPATLQALQRGQTISLPIPDLQPISEATIESTHSPLDGITVFKGGMNAGQPGDNVIITRGEIDTIFVVSTSTGVYTAIVSNRTGEGSLVSEADINARAVPLADGIMIAPVKMPLPERDHGS